MYLNKETFHQLVEAGQAIRREQRFLARESDHEMDNSILEFFMGRPSSRYITPLAIVVFDQADEVYLVVWNESEQREKWCHMTTDMWEYLCEEWE